jgi:hypothetical protein
MKTELILAGVLALVVSTAANVAAADETGFGRSVAPAPLEGTWEVAVRPYACSTGVEVGVTSQSYLTFSAGGTMFEMSSVAGYKPGQRGPGFGYWERTGLSSYEAVFQAFILFTTDPASPPPLYTRGSQRVEQIIELIDADHWQATWAVTFRDESGNQYRQGCARAVATRMP